MGTSQPSNFGNILGKFGIFFLPFPRLTSRIFPSLSPFSKCQIPFSSFRKRGKKKGKILEKELQFRVLFPQIFQPLWELQNGFFWVGATKALCASLDPGQPENSQNSTLPKGPGWPLLIFPDPIPRENSHFGCFFRP